VAHWSITVPPALKVGLSLLQSFIDWVKKRLHAACVSRNFPGLARWAWEGEGGVSLASLMV